ncbi:pyridoxamine 5'-phosphate oxidase family protein [Amycolatopsis sp. NPDC051903]|uniref:pyridoxamine 5'-phosphate oxidase family protein n=1 Tax=Amycolatopsis sp. NPDC051903 TaxID=3363936 RepID=UPI0037AB4C2A
MTTWQSFAAAAPSLADHVHRRFTAGESHVLATLRRDGSPRVSGSEVDFRDDGRLYIGSMLGAVKARDLRRDGRFAVHAYPGIEDGGEGDAKLAGVAEEITAPDEVARLGVDPASHLFHLDIQEAVYTWVADNTLFVESWHDGGAWVRFARPDNGPAEKTVLG